MQQDAYPASSPIGDPASEQPTTSPLPTSDEFRPVVLQVMADGQERSIHAIHELTAIHAGLSEEMRQERIPSGQLRYVNRINWACSGLYQAGLLRRPRRGHYVITDDGLTVKARNLASYSERDMEEWPAWRAYQREIAARRNSESTTAATPGTPANPGAPVAAERPDDPIELMSEAEKAFNAKVETELRKRLQEASPEFFEKAVIDLLWAMGYGGTHGGKQHLGRSGDGGIDGIIRQDALGLTNIFVQAKRYSDTNRVGDPEIRNFIGAMDTRGATLGVFITTSTFLPSAQRTAQGYRHGRIILIDGLKLTTLMLAYGVAVHKAREFVLFEIDDDFFDEDLT